MVRKMRKMSLLILATVLSTSALAACSKNSDKETAPSSAASASASTTELSSGFKNGKFDPLVTITTVGGVNQTFLFKNNETLDNNVHTKWAKDELGIELKYNYVTASDQYANKIRLSLSANEQLPDVMMIYDKALLAELIDSGLLMDVTDAFNKYASKQVAGIYSQDPAYWSQVTKNGKRYGIPVLSPSMGSDPLLWLRTDWLDKVGLKAPSNFDELEKLMDVMVNQDPSGKGGKNPPLALSLKNGFATWQADASWIFGGYGVIPGFWNKWNGDKLEYGSIQPKTKEALAKLQDWFKKGYISTDVGLLDETKAMEQMSAEKSGMIFGPVWMGGSFKSTLLKNNPNAKIRPFPIPAGPSGKAGRQGTTIQNGALVVRKDFKNMDALMLYVNKLYEYSDPDVNSKYANGWAEGYDYVMKDGAPSKNIKDFPDGKIVSYFKYFLTQTNMVDPFRELNIRKDLAEGKKPAKPLENQWYNVGTDSEKSNPETSNTWYAAKVLLGQKDASIQNLFTGAPTETMKVKNEALLKLENETFLKIVYNQAPIDEFDNFVKKWKEMGGDQITTEVNKWYSAAAAK